MDLHENYHVSVSVKSMSKKTEDLINWLQSELKDKYRSFIRL